MQSLPLIQLQVHERRAERETVGGENAQEGASRLRAEFLVATVQLLGTIALELADSPVLPLQYSLFTDLVDDRTSNAGGGDGVPVLAEWLERALVLQQEVQALTNTRHVVSQLALRILNDKLLLLQRALPATLPTSSREMDDLMRQALPSSLPVLAA